MSITLCSKLVRVKIVCLLIILTQTDSLIAQNPEQKLGNWIGATSSMRFSKKWSLFLQGELRTWEMVSNLNELLWRTAIYYDFNSNLKGASGYVRVDTWPYDNEPYSKFYENRIFQEFKISSKWGKLKLTNRFRLEQRWISTVEYGTEYSNRIRYMLGLTIQLNSTKVEKVTNSIVVFNEVFIDFDRFDYWFDREAGESGLNQNRLYAGFKHQLTDLSNFSVGLLWQHRPGANFYRLIMSYAQNLDFIKEKK